MFGLGLLAGFGLYAYVKTAPAPETVCANVRHVMEGSLANDARLNPELRRTSLDQLERSCLVEVAPPKYGVFKWAQQVRCMADSRTIDALGECGGRARNTVSALAKLGR